MDFSRQAIDRVALEVEGLHHRIEMDVFDTLDSSHRVLAGRHGTRGVGIVPWADILIVPEFAAFQFTGASVTCERKDGGQEHN